MDSIRNDPVWAREATYPKESIERGARGPHIRRVQEWLVLGGKNIVIDGDFGPATAAALGANYINFDKWYELVAPMRDLTVEQVKGWLKPDGALPNIREVGGPNAGPWVRLFMNGQEGPAWPWCAGFVTWVRRTVGCSLLSTRTFSCDLLWSAAEQARIPTLVRPTGSAAKAGLKQGALFMVTNPKNRSDRTHVGFVTGVSSDGETISTLEGNTNDAGSREGYEVCRRTRATGNLDFILTATP